MFKSVMDHQTVIDLPILALVIFMVVFAVVVLRVWRRGTEDTRFSYLSQLPLADDDVLVDVDATPKRGTISSRGGADHE